MKFFLQGMICALSKEGQNIRVNTLQPDFKEHFHNDQFL